MPAAAQALGVVVGREVAGERRRGAAAAERARGRFEHGGLAGAGRSHQVDRDHAVARESARGCAPPCDRCRRGSCRGPRPARARDRRSRRYHTSRHLHLDAIEHDLVALGQARGRQAAHRSRLPRPIGSPQRSARPVRRHDRDVELRASRRSVRSRNVVVRRVEQLDVDARQLADADATAGAPRWRGAAALPLRRARPATGRSSTRASATSRSKRGARFSKKLSRPSANSRPSAMRASARAPDRGGRRADPCRPPG